MKAEIHSHPWSTDALLAKAKIWSGRMHEAETNGSEQGIFSAITLELLARAALSNISPILLADEKNWRNLSYAIGENTTAKKFTPSSIGIKEVISRLADYDSKNTLEIQNFCALHFDKRNSEFHSGEMAFIEYESSSWLPRFYQAAEVFLNKAGSNIENFFPEPNHVKSLIDSLSDKAAESVKGNIEAYKRVWQDKAQSEQELESKKAEVWATRQTGHRVACPACKCVALVQGTPTGPVQTKISDDEIQQKQNHIPSSFECIACGLKIVGFSKLVACQLGNTFTSTSSTAPSDFFGLYTEEEIETAVDEARTEVENKFNAPDYND